MSVTHSQSTIEFIPGIQVSRHDSFVVGIFLSYRENGDVLPEKIGLYFVSGVPARSKDEREPLDCKGRRLQVAFQTGSYSFELAGIRVHLLCFHVLSRGLFVRDRIATAYFIRFFVH